MSDSGLYGLSGSSNWYDVALLDFMDLGRQGFDADEIEYYSRLKLKGFELIANQCGLRNRRIPEE